MKIRQIVILKNGFLLKPANRNNPKIPDNKNFYLIVFNSHRNHTIFEEIAKYIKKERAWCPENLLIRNLNLKYSHIYNRFYYDLTQNKSRLEHATWDFICYKIINYKRSELINDDNIELRTNIIQSLIKRKKINREGQCYWFGGDNIDIITTKEKSISDYNADKPKWFKNNDQQKFDNEKIESTSILSIDSKKYIKFECRAENISYNILTAVKPAKNEVIIPIRREINTKFDDYLNNKCNVLIVGPPSVGKSKLVCDGIKKLKNTYVFSLNLAAFRNLSAIKISKDIVYNKLHLIWVIDDLNNVFELELKTEINMILEMLKKEFKSISIVMTTRSGQYTRNINFFKNFIKNIKEVKINKWSMKEGYLFCTSNSIDPKKLLDFDGTPLSLINCADLTTMKGIFDLYKDEEKENWSNVLLMRYLALLSKISPSYHYALLREVYFCLQNKYKHTNNFENSINQLESDGFISIENENISTWNTYIKNIVFQDDYWDIIKDVKKLINPFKKYKQISGLAKLGHILNDSQNFINAIECWKYIIKSKDIKTQRSEIALIYYYWGGSLMAIFSQEKRESKFEEACEKFKFAIQYKTDFANAYNDYGSALFRRGALKNNIDDYKEARRQFETALQIDNEYFDAYSNLGSVLMSMGRIKGDNNYHHKAIENFKKAAKIRENYEIFYNWAICLLDINSYDESCEKFAMAAQYDTNPVIFDKWGDALLESGKCNLNSNKIKEASELFRFVINYRVDNEIDCEKNIYTFMKLGFALSLIGDIEDDLESYEKACNIFKIIIDLNDNFAEPYANLGLSYIKIGIMTEDHQNFDIALDLINTAIVIFISKNNSQEALNLAKNELINSEGVLKQNIPTIIFAVFLIGLKNIGNNNKKLDDFELNTLKEYKKYFKGAEFIYNAIIHNEKPNQELSQDPNELFHNAAIILSDEIVYTSNQ